MEPSDYLFDAGTSTESVQWMQPSEALACFEPPEGLHLLAAGKVQKEQRTRYGFRIGELGLLINPDVGSEVLSIDTITPLPAAPAGFLGLINLRGNLVPVYDMHTMLGRTRRHVGTGIMVLVFGQGDQAVGVVIDGYPVALNSLQKLVSTPILPDALQGHTHAGYMQEEEIWLEFDHGAYFNETCREYIL